jgi:hypothetical protein
VACPCRRGAHARRCHHVAHAARHRHYNVAPGLNSGEPPYNPYYWASPANN